MFETLIQQNITSIIIFVSSFGVISYMVKDHSKRISKLEEDRDLFMEVRNDVKWILSEVKDLKKEIEKLSNK